MGAEIIRDIPGLIGINDFQPFGRIKATIFGVFRAGRPRKKAAGRVKFSGKNLTVPWVNGGRLDL